jgi:hypothetical protein
MHYSFHRSGQRTIVILKLLPLPAAGTCVQQPSHKHSTSIDPQALDIHRSTSPATLDSHRAKQQDIPELRYRTANDLCVPIREERSWGNALTGVKCSPIEQREGWGIKAHDGIGRRISHQLLIAGGRSERVRAHFSLLHRFSGRRQDKIPRVQSTRRQNL